MSQTATTFRAVIHLWPSIRDLATDVGRRYETVRGWHRRNSIPPSQWDRLIESARFRQIQGVSLARLQRITAASERGRPTSFHQTFSATSTQGYPP